MYAKLIINVVLAAIAIIIQIGLISALPGLFKEINILLILLVFILSLGGFRLAFWWALGAGIVINIYYFIPFGIVIISIMVAIIVTNFLLTNFFTNRSLYSFLFLTLIALVTYKIILFIITWLYLLIRPSELGFIVGRNYLLNEFMAIAINLGIVVIVFYFINMVTKSLKPVFLFKRSQLK